MRKLLLVLAGSIMAALALGALLALAQGTGASFFTPNGQVVPGYAALVPCGPITNGQPTFCPPSLATGLPVSIVGGASSGFTTVTSTPFSGTIAAANTFQSLLTLNASRKGCRVQNRSPDVEFISDQASPSIAGSFLLKPGDYFDCASAGVIRGDALQIAGGTVGDAYAGDSQ